MAEQIQNWSYSEIYCAALKSIPKPFTVSTIIASRPANLYLEFIRFRNKTKLYTSFQSGKLGQGENLSSSLPTSCDRILAWAGFLMPSWYGLSKKHSTFIPVKSLPLGVNPKNLIYSQIDFLGQSS